jgi:HK97 family phage prohead protease
MAKYDFSGYATKAGLRCSDGRTIMPGAFKHQDQMKVPLVWQHGHNDPENVLGHAILENREDGVYAYGYFNDSVKANHAKSLLEHGDINMLSIWANELIEKAGRVLHGAIREVSLVLSGANPGAIIESVTIRHSDGFETQLEDEAIIYTGIELLHSVEVKEIVNEPINVIEHVDKVNEPIDVIEHVDKVKETPMEMNPDMTVEDVFETLTEEQKKVVYFLIGQAVEDGEASLAQSGLDDDANAQEVYESLNEKQKELFNSLFEDAQEEINHANQKGQEMSHNIFENNNNKAQAAISHADLQGIVADASKVGSLKDAIESYALSHGITNVDQLFPEATALDAVPEWLKRRTEWVSKLLGDTRKSPFSRIKTMHADITLEDARAKGYVTAALKKEEYFGVSKRITTPTTIYKKQKLDRDDMIDITDFDVVTWLKAEMRMMLDEEIARAILIGDGRDVSHEDKINEGNIRPIAKDHELYTTVVNVNIDDASSSVQEVIDAIINNRKHFKGTGTPTMYTTETYIAQFLLLKDTLGRRIYRDLGELASELRVVEIVPVEVMEEETELVAILVNPQDYVLGADKGGAISMFDDFDIDYNQHKYLIETRLCGALIKMKSAIVVKKVAASAVLATPTAPTFVSATNTITIPTVTGVTYKQGAVTKTGSFVITADTTIDAYADSGYYFASSVNDSFNFKYTA